MKRLFLFLLLATSIFGQGQDSIRAVGGVLTINLVPSSTRYKVFVDQAITSTVFNNPIDRATITVLFVQDTTGHAVSFGGNISGGCAAVGSVSSAASATTACQFTFDAANNAWTGIIGGGSNPTVSLPGPVFNVKDPKYGAVGDAKHSNNVVLNGTTTITSADNPWTSADVGKLIFCVFTGTPTNGFTAGTKIATFVSAGNVTTSAVPTGGAATYQCTWATQDDTAAFQAAEAAAAINTTSRAPNLASPTLTYPGTVYVPPGGYMVSGNIFDFSAASGSTLAPSFKGAGSSSTIIYPRSDTFTSGASACLMDVVQGVDFTLSGFYIHGSQWGFNCGGFPFIRINASSNFIMQDIGIFSVGVTNGGAEVLHFTQANNAYLNQVNMQNTSANNGGTTPLFELDSSAGITIEQCFFSNNTVNAPNLVFNGSGNRNAVGQQVTMISGGSDECSSGTSPCTKVVGASFVNLLGGSFFGEPTGAGNGALTVDATSGAYLQSVNVGPFSTASNSNGLAIASGGFVYATGSHIRGGGTTGSVVDGPAGATFVDDGGNTFQRCNGATCTNITGTTYAGAFTSGIVPNTSLTHTYPQPFLPALPASGTALNIVAFTPSNSITVRNFTITAGNIPTCATPPTFQISNGTQSFTQTFASAAQISGPFTPAATLFPAGTQVTLSITNAAYACATAPVNMNWSIEWQSAVSF